MRNKIALLLERFLEFLCGKYEPNSKFYKILESKVPNYSLPNPLILSDGTKVQDAYTWQNLRRPEILEMFRKYVFGKSPEKLKNLSFIEGSTDESALEGLATRKEVFVGLTNKEDGPVMNLLLYIPNKIKNSGSAAPLFLGLNSKGNHAIHTDSGIMLNQKLYPLEKPRGFQAKRWPLEFILKNGYALATSYCGDTMLDKKDSFSSGIHPYFYKQGQYKPFNDEWGAIGAWAWGLSRAMDYFEKDKLIDNNKIAVFGHSRLGKAALWAGAQDQRFALVISNNSGCGGAALSRRHFGETVNYVNEHFPHWFCNNFKKFNEKENELPVDQHMLISLIAPRPVYIASAQMDLWCDPKGEFLAAKHANPVYRLLGTKGLPSETMPDINCPIMGTIGYHIRQGKHNITPYDWQQYIKFANIHLKNKPE